MKVASIVKDMSASQNVFYMTKCFNKMLNDDISPSCFYLNLSTLTIWPQFAYMNIYYSSGFFDGIMVATCLETAKIMGALNNKCRKILYLWDLEWLRSPIDYEETYDLLHKFDLVSRGENHRLNILNYCGKDSLIIEDWDYEKMKGLINDRKSA